MKLSQGIICFLFFPEIALSPCPVPWNQKFDFLCSEIAFNLPLILCSPEINVLAFITRVCFQGVSFFADGFCPSCLLTGHMETVKLKMTWSDFDYLPYGNLDTANCKHKITLSFNVFASMCPVKKHDGRKPSAKKTTTKNKKKTKTKNKTNKSTEIQYFLVNAIYHGGVRRLVHDTGRLLTLKRQFWRHFRQPFRSQWKEPNQTFFGRQYRYFSVKSIKLRILLWFLTVTCSCCPYLYLVQLLC